MDAEGQEREVARGETATLRGEIPQTLTAQAPPRNSPD